MAASNVSTGDFPLYSAFIGLDRFFDDLSFRFTSTIPLTHSDWETRLEWRSLQRLGRRTTERAHYVAVGAGSSVLLGNTVLFSAVLRPDGKTEAAYDEMIETMTHGDTLFRSSTDHPYIHLPGDGCG